MWTGTVAKPAGVLAGLMLQFQWYLNANQREKALAIGQEMLTRFELEANWRSHVAAAVGNSPGLSRRVLRGKPGADISVFP